MYKMLGRLALISRYLFSWLSDGRIKRECSAVLVLDLSFGVINRHGFRPDNSRLLAGNNRASRIFDAQDRVSGRQPLSQAHARKPPGEVLVMRQHDDPFE